MTRYIVQVQPLTVVHIGTGEEFGPMDYVIREQVYYRFRPEAIVATLDGENRKSFNDLLDKGNIREIALFLHKHVTRKNALYTSPAASSLAATVKGKQNDLNNQLLIHSTYRSLTDGTPIIPGSSLKGAIRTAILDDFASKLSQVRDERHPDKEILGYRDAKNDPFRGLRISDCPISGEHYQAVAQFVNFKEKRKSGQDFSKMQIFSEIITGALAEGDATGWCELQVDEELLNVPNPNPKSPEKNYFGKRFTFNQLISACNAFYLKNLAKEIVKFYRHSSHRELKAMAEKLTRLGDEILQEKNQCLIRVGQFSQVENVTLNEPHRQPWNKKGYGNTRTITDTYLPAGWVKLTFLTEAEAKEQQKRLNLKREQARLKEEKIRLEKERKEVEARAEAERLANLPEDQTMLIRIKKLPNDTSEIANIVRECLESEFPASVFAALREKLKELEQWNPSGSKQRKQKMMKRNKDIEARING